MQKNIWPFLIIAAVLGGAVFIGFRSASKPVPGETRIPSPEEASLTSSSAPSNLAETSTPSSSTPAVAFAPASSGSSKSVPMPRPVPVSERPEAQPVTTLSALYKIYDEIETAADDSTPESLATIIGYACNTDDANVRTAAISALIRRNDPQASPFLRAAAKKADSTDVTIALLKAADYLELPPAKLQSPAERARQKQAMENAKQNAKVGPWAPVTNPAPAPSATQMVAP